MTAIKKIAFIGATGMLGKPVAIELAKAGFEVTAMVRDTERAKKELPANIRLIKGDLRSQKDIGKALQGNDAMYINLSVEPTAKEWVFQPEREGLDNLLTVACKVGGIRRIAYLSSLVQRYQGMTGFHWWVFAVKLRAVEQIKASDIPYTIFYPSTFMESFALGAYRQGNRINLAGESKYRLYLIAASDYGKQVGRSFEILSDQNREYVVQGPEAYTADQAAAIFTQHYRKERLRIIKVPLGLLKWLGKFGAPFDYGAHIIEALNNYPEKFEAETTWQELGKPEMTLKTFAEHEGERKKRVGRTG